MTSVKRFPKFATIRFFIDNKSVEFKTSDPFSVFRTDLNYLWKIFYEKCGFSEPPSSTTTSKNRKNPRRRKAEREALARQAKFVDKINLKPLEKVKSQIERVVEAANLFVAKEGVSSPVHRNEPSSKPPEKILAKESADNDSVASTSKTSKSSKTSRRVSKLRSVKSQSFKLGDHVFPKFRHYIEHLKIQNFVDPDLIGLHVDIPLEKYVYSLIHKEVNDQSRKELDDFFSRNWKGYINVLYNTALVEHKKRLSQRPFLKRLFAKN